MLTVTRMKIGMGYLYAHLLETFIQQLEYVNIVEKVLIL